jgi:hypothetical protein
MNAQVRKERYKEREKKTENKSIELFALIVLCEKMFTQINIVNVSV